MPGAREEKGGLANEKRHAIAYKDKMVVSGATPATIRKPMGGLGSLLQVGVDSDLCAVNVARDVKIRGGKVAAEGDEEVAVCGADRSDSEADQ